MMYEEAVDVEYTINDLNMIPNTALHFCEDHSEPEPDLHGMDDTRLKPGIRHRYEEFVSRNKDVVVRNYDSDLTYAFADMYFKRMDEMASKDSELTAYRQKVDMDAQVLSSYRKKLRRYENMTFLDRVKFLVFGAKIMK